MKAKASQTDEAQQDCCGRGGVRPGCGRKPGVKTHPVRLPQWLLSELEARGDIKQGIIEACVHHYNLDWPKDAEGHTSD